MKRILVVFSVVSFLLLVAVGMVCCNQARAGMPYIPPPLEEDYNGDTEQNCVPLIAEKKTGFLFQRAREIIIKTENGEVAGRISRRDNPSLWTVKIPKGTRVAFSFPPGMDGFVEIIFFDEDLARKFELAD